MDDRGVIIVERNIVSVLRENEPPQEPREPLAERDAEIARLQARIAVLEDAVQVAGVYLTNSTPVNAVKLNDALRKAQEDKHE
jgi:hypothetical protein